MSKYSEHIISGVKLRFNRLLVAVSSVTCQRLPDALVKREKSILG